MRPEPVLIEYTSIYDEKLSQAAFRKVASNKFSSLSNTAPDPLPPIEIQKAEVVEKIKDFKLKLQTLLKQAKSQFPSLEANVLKLKLKDTSVYKTFNQSLFASSIRRGLCISETLFPGEFGETIEEIKRTVAELLMLKTSTLYTGVVAHINPVYNIDNVLKFLNLDNSSRYAHTNLNDAMMMGITPVDNGNFYRVHATNPPPDAFKSATRGIGLGKYMYLAFIHHCGHGYTDHSSVDALKMWKSLVTKRDDIYCFMAPEVGSDYILAITTKMSKEQVLELLNKWIREKATFPMARGFFGVKTFQTWLAYRKKYYNDEPNTILDDGLEVLLREEIAQAVTEDFINANFGNIVQVTSSSTSTGNFTTPYGTLSDEALADLFVQKMLDNHSTMNEIITSASDVFLEALNRPTRSSFKAIAEFFDSFNQTEAKYVSRSIYFYLRRFTTITERDVVNVVTAMGASQNAFDSMFLGVAWANSIITIHNLRILNLPMREVNTILKSLYSRYQGQQVKLKIGNEEIQILNKYINLSGNFSSYTREQMVASLVDTFPTNAPEVPTQTPIQAPASSVQPPISSTRISSRGQRRSTASANNSITTWISSVGKTETSIMGFLRRHTQAALHRKYVTWCSNNNMTPVGALALKQYLQRNYPAVATQQGWR